MNLLIECARPGSALVPEAAAAVADWNSAVQQSVRHGLAPLLYWHLSRACPGAAPSDVLNSLRARFTTNAGRNLSLTAELLNLLSRFREAAIGVVPFKGPAIAWSLYETAALREMNDIDLLVRPSDARRAVDLLIAAGYQCPYSPDLRFFQSNRELPLVSPSGVAVDLHWALVPGYLGRGLDLEAIWSRLQPVQVAGQPVLTLGNEDLLVFLCVHGAKHAWCSLHWLADIARLIDRSEIDWDALLARIQTDGIARIVSIGLLLAVDLLGAPIPPATVALLRANAPASAIAARLQESIAAGPVRQPGIAESLRFQLALLDRPLDKFRLIWGTLPPTPAECDALRLPSPLFSLYYAFRPLRLMAKHLGSRL
jgi:Uncharacterised nucleotidyltransferase